MCKQHTLIPTWGILTLVKARIDKIVYQHDCFCNLAAVCVIMSNVITAFEEHGPGAGSVFICF